MNEQYFKIYSAPVKEKIHDWWENLLQNRGDGAELRRCHDLNEVFFCPAFHQLYQSLRGDGPVKKEALALIAVSLAYVRNNEARDSFAAQMGDEKSVGTPQVSEIRFKKLVRSESHHELFSPVIRIIRMLDGAVNIDDLVSKLYYWNDKSRQKMTFEYYEKVLHIEEKSGGKKE